MNFDNQLFRASSMGYIMTDPRSKGEDLSETTKTHLIDVYVHAKYGRRSDIFSKAIEKGTRVEEDSITLYSRLTKTFFRKNEEHLANDYVKGTPDLFLGTDIHSAEIIIDIKSSWDLYTFFRVHTQPINKMYWWQMQTYMALTGAKKARLVYCLVNTPDSMIAEEQRRLAYKMGALTNESEEYVKAAEELEAAMKFDDIPMRERVIPFEIERDEEAIHRMYERITKCRQYLNLLEQQINPPVIVAEKGEGVTLVA